MNRETIAKAIEAEAVKADDLARRLQDQGDRLSYAREAGRAERLRQAALAVRESACEDCDGSKAAKGRTCPSRMGAYECALPAGHLGQHEDEGRFTIWPDAADTRSVVTAACEDCNDTGNDPAPDAPGAIPPKPCLLCDPDGGGCDHEGAPGHRANPPPAVPQPGEHPLDYCGPCKAGKHAKCYEPCLCRDRAHGAPPPRTLPVTPAERCAAGMLRAYADCALAADDVTDRPDVVSLIDDFEIGAARLGWIAGKPGGQQLTPAGRALLARVEGEPTAPPRSDAYDQAVRDVCAMLRAEHAEGSVGSFDFAARCIESQFRVTPPAAPPPREGLPPVPLLSDEAIKSPIAALLWFADEGHYEGTYRKGAGFADACGMSIARRALGLPVDRPDNTLMPLSEALAARLAAPPAKEPR